MKTVTKDGITYKLPQVHVLQETGIGVAEFAGRTAYDSFGKSEHACMKELDTLLNIDDVSDMVLTTAQHHVNSISDSKLLDSLAWVHHHMSVLEHSYLSYSIKGISRSVLQELVRHRIASYTVRSTRYTMSSVINAFIASQSSPRSQRWFHDKIKEMQTFVLDGAAESLEIDHLYEKLYHQYVEIKSETFINTYTSRDMRSNGALQSEDAQQKYAALQLSKQVRNIGDSFKWVVTDNWSTNLVLTINLRSLKNFFELRDSGAAYFMIQELAKAMKKATPTKYLRLIDRKAKGD